MLDEEVKQLSHENLSLELVLSTNLVALVNIPRPVLRLSTKVAGEEGFEMSTLASSLPVVSRSDALSFRAPQSERLADLSLPFTLIVVVPNDGREDGLLDTVFGILRYTISPFLCILQIHDHWSSDLVSQLRDQSSTDSRFQLLPFGSVLPNISPMVKVVAGSRLGESWLQDMYTGDQPTSGTAD
ncbi:hypothetical protein [Muricoccus radiodurans]|uniref:hypothetical protein n=1 Tax=Muricoccus radiodurans TaxID=2231721 RepID=UPI003CF9FF4E